MRDYESVPRGPYVSFDDLLRPNHSVTGYATTWVWVAEPTAAALHVGTGGPYEIWVDGTSVGRGDAYRMADPLQDVHAVGLAAGWNRILVKVSALDGMWGFFARLSAPGGGPLSGLRRAVERPAETPAEGRARPTPPEPASIRGALEARWRKGKSRAVGLDLVELYRYTHPFDSRRLGCRRARP